MATPSSSSSVIFLITGASRGLGKAIATVAGQQFAPRPETARFLLAARSSQGLHETKKDLVMASQGSITSKDVICRSMDLSNLDRLDSNIDRLLHDLDTLRQSRGDSPKDSHSNNTHILPHHQQLERLIFVNNAASLGHLGPSRNSPSLEDMRHTIDFNVTACLWLSVRLARYMTEGILDSNNRNRNRNSNPPPQPHPQGTIVNISSLSAVAADFPGMGIYSAGKAAREMYHTLLAQEEAAAAEFQAQSAQSDDSRLVKVLNYAPGPLETSMTQDHLRTCTVLDDRLQSQFRQPLLDPKDSARKLLRLLDANEFESGSHVDYYDLPD